MAYLFRHDMIAVCLDFIMQDKSPLNLIKDRVDMGYSRNYNPDFSAISGVLGYLI